MQIVSEYGVLAIFMIILLEYACFPISSELVLPLSGMLTAQIGFPLFGMILLSVLAGVFGSLICYALGRWGGERVISRILRRFPKMADKFQRACHLQERYGKWAVMLGRIIPIFRTYISFASGLTGQNAVEFIGFSAFGIFLWNTVLLGCGYFLGENFSLVLPFIQKYFVFFALLIILFIAAVYFMKKKLAGKKSR